MGNTHPGDGFRFRGRGLVQLTGRSMYTTMDRELGLNGALLANPDLVNDPQMAARVAALYYRDRSSRLLGEGPGRHDLATAEGATGATGPATPKAAQIRGANAARYRGKTAGYAARGAALTIHGAAGHPGVGADVGPQNHPPVGADEAPRRYALGGEVRGPGGPTSDVIPARLSLGDFVVNAGATARHRAILEAINRGNILPGYSAGGAVAREYGGSGAAGVVESATNYAGSSIRYNRQHRGLYDDLPHGLRGDGDAAQPTPLHPYSSRSVYGPDTSGVLAFPRPSTPLWYMGKGFDRKAPAIMRGLMDRYGLTREQAAGVVGNLGHESRGFTAYQEDKPRGGRGGAGWAQWTGPRRRAFEAWTEARGLDPISDDASWRYLTEGDPETDRAIAAVKRTTDPHDAMRAWHDAYEKSGDTDPHTGEILVPKNWTRRRNYSDRANTMGPAPAMRRFQGDPLPPDHRADASPAARASSVIGADLPIGERVIGVMASPTDGALRDAERAVLPHRSLLPERDDSQARRAFSGSVDFDHGSLLAAIGHVDDLHRKLQGLRAVVSLEINHRHRHEGEGTGAVRSALNGNFGSDGRAFT